MSKPIRAQKKDEYIRFRPYHVFAVRDADARRQDRVRAVGGIVLALVVLVVIFIGASIVLHHHH